MVWTARKAPLLDMLLLVCRGAHSRRSAARAQNGAGEDLHLRNHVWFCAEQVSATGDQVGNFPQAFTHLALISAAINLDDALK
jgi:hypothetical protein